MDEYMSMIKQVQPDEIEPLSFAIIEREFQSETGRDSTSYSPEIFQIVRRVIHATGDFSFANSMRFHERAVASGVGAIKQGKDIYLDVSMGAAGVSAPLLHKFGGKVQCTIHDPQTKLRAQAEHYTRSEAAVRGLKGTDIGIVGVGNAPTALLALLDMIKHEEIAPALIVGVPVGFVNATESKELLLSSPTPYITSRGRKGGSPVVAAIINAILRLAVHA